MKFLTHRHWHSILPFRAAHFQNAFEFLSFFVKGL